MRRAGISHWGTRVAPVVQAFALRTDTWYIRDKSSTDKPMASNSLRSWLAAFGILGTWVNINYTRRRGLWHKYLLGSERRPGA